MLIQKQLLILHSETKQKDYDSISIEQLWRYIQGLSLNQNDREWLASKLIESTADDAKTAKQKAYVKESLYRALDEVKVAKSEGRRLKTLDEFLEELETEETA